MPRKAAWIALETTDLGFEHYLVEKLGFGTVAEMRRRMPMSEYVTWVVYYQRKAQQIELQQLKQRGR